LAFEAIPAPGTTSNNRNFKGFGSAAGSLVLQKSITIFGGTSNPQLTSEVCRYVGIPEGERKIARFSDGEIYVEIGENVRGVNCFVLQSTSSPPNDSLMELLITIDALKRASAGSIVAIMPYFGYARQDRKVKPRTPISAKLVADLLTAAGATRVLSVDLHAGQIQGFFNIPFDHLYGSPVLIAALEAKGLAGEEAVVVSPDAGGVERARQFSKALRCPLAIIDKRRDAPNQSQVHHLIGEVAGKRAIMVDDMCDTAGTLCNAAQAVMDHGALEVHAAVTHGVLSGPAIGRINASVLANVFVTNTIPQEQRIAECAKIRVLSVGNLIGEAVKRIHHGDSLSSLFP
jgi:ribose-phosphate pyrophosphokinase